MDRWKVAALVLAGVLVGVVLAGPRVTGAEGHQQFKECVAYGNMKLAQQPKRFHRHAVAVPEGWTVVGGLGGTMLLCR